MAIDPSTLANAVLGVIILLGLAGRNFSATGRNRRRELRRLREVVELYAAYDHRCHVATNQHNERKHPDDDGFTLPVKPEKLRRLLRQDDEDDEDDLVNIGDGE